MDDDIVDWDKVNQKHCGTKYLDEAVAKAVLGGTAINLSPANNPFKKMFGVGINLGGYWDYHQMSVQFEDVHNILKTMYPDFEIEYYFDRSSCHDKMLENGLNIAHLYEWNVWWQATSHAWNSAYCCWFTQSQTCCGWHPDPMTCIQREGNLGPHYETEEQRERTKYTQVDRVDGRSKRRQDPWCWKPYEMLVLNFPMAFLCQRASHIWAATWPWIIYMKRDGLLIQRAYARCYGSGDFLIQPKSIQWRDQRWRWNKGLCNLTLSLKHILSQQPNFRNELTALQHLAKQEDGHKSYLLTKVSCRDSQRGNQVLLGNCKELLFNRLPLSERNPREKVEAKVKEALSTSVLTITWVRGSSWRQWWYILAYEYMHHEEAVDCAAAAKEFVDTEKMAKLLCKMLTIQQQIKIQHTLGGSKCSEWEDSSLLLTFSAMHASILVIIIVSCSWSVLEGDAWNTSVYWSLDKFLVWPLVACRALLLNLLHCVLWTGCGETLERGAY